MPEDGKMQKPKVRTGEVPRPTIPIFNNTYSGQKLGQPARRAFVRLWLRYHKRGRELVQMQRKNVRVAKYAIASVKLSIINNSISEHPTGNFNGSV
jgi:hypothetical protein